MGSVCLLKDLKERSIVSDFKLTGQGEQCTKNKKIWGGGNPSEMTVVLDMQSPLLEMEEIKEDMTSFVKSSSAPEA